MSPLTVLIAPQKVLVLDRLGGTAAAERRGAGPGEARQLGRVPLGLLELKSCFLLDLTESRHSAVPSGRAGGHSPSGALLRPPPGRRPLRATWAAQLGGRFWLRGERSRQSTPTGHRPRGGDMSAGGGATRGWRWASVASPLWTLGSKPELLSGGRPRGSGVTPASEPGRTTVPMRATRSRPAHSPARPGARPLLTPAAPGAPQDQGERKTPEPGPRSGQERTAAASGPQSQVALGTVHEDGLRAGAGSSVPSARPVEEVA